MSDSVVKKKISELASQSRFEPQMRTVLVEGSEDRRVYSYLVDNCPSSCFLPIQFVDIPLPDVPRDGAGSGNRARVIEAAIQLKNHDANPDSIICIADTDLGFILDKGPQVQHILFYTDATCLEVYYYNPSSIQRYLENYCGCSHLNAGEILRELNPPLKLMMSIRIALTELGIPISWIDNIELIGTLNGGIIFDQRKHLLKILGKSANVKRVAEVMARCEYWNSVVLHMPNHECIHGHDFINTLRSYLRIKGIANKRLDREVFFPSFSVCGKITDFSKTQTLSELQNFTSGHSS